VTTYANRAEARDALFAATDALDVRAVREAEEWAAAVRA
jgi:hypothetical protein